MHGIKILVSPWQNPKEFKKQIKKKIKTRKQYMLEVWIIYTHMRLKKKDNLREEITRGSS